MAYRATRTESKVAVGEWTRDLYKGEVIPTAQVPDEVADHLIDHGFLIECNDKDEDNPWFDSEDETLNGGVKNDELHGPISNIKSMQTPVSATTTSRPEVKPDKDDKKQTPSHK